MPTVRKAPRFEKLIDSKHEVSTRTVSLIFQDKESNNYEIELHHQCVPLSIFALTNEFGSILSTLPVQERPAVQTLRGTGVRPAIGADGNPALILHLERGAELTIEFSKEAIAEVAKGLSELVTAMDRSQYH